MEKKQEELAALFKKNPRELQAPKKNEVPTATPTQTTPKAVAKVPAKRGRKKVKTEECKTINIAVPVSVLEQIDIAKVSYESNLTKYVNDVIAKDLEANMGAYQQIYNLLKR